MNRRFAVIALAVAWSPLAVAQAPAGDGEDPPEVAAPEQVTPPRLIEDAQPEFPASAQEAGLTDAVTLEIDIDASGAVTRAVVVVSAEHPGHGFDEAALAAARRLVFEPARMGDQAIPVRINYRFRFVPDVTDPPPDVEVPPPPGPPEPPPAPTGRLVGELRERGTRLPLRGVTVTVFRGEGDDAVGFDIDTDDEGEFELDDLPVGEWRLLSEPAGYFPLRSTETVEANEQTRVRYRLERQSYNPYDVVVETDRVHREVSRTTIDARAAERVPGTFGDVLNVIQNFPGVARTGFGSGGFAVRGAAPEDTRFFVDGIDVPLIYHFLGLKSVLPTGMIQNIDFYPGNYSVEYGRATGGIIDLRLRDLQRESFGGYADISILDAGAYLEAPITDDLSIAVAGRRSYIDAVLRPILGGGDDGNRITAPRYYDFQLLAQWRPSPAHRLKTFFMFSDDKFEIIFGEPLVGDPMTVINDVGLTTRFYRGLLEYQYVPNERVRADVRLSLGQDEFHFNVGQALVADETRLRGQARGSVRWQSSDAIALRVGLDYAFSNVERELTIPPISDDDPRDTVVSTFRGDVHSTAGFAEVEIKPAERSLAVLGVRLDHFSRISLAAASPRLTLRQELGAAGSNGRPRWALKGGVGLFLQEPQLEQTDATLGNPGLGPEQAIHYSVGVEYRPLSHLLFDVTGFYKSLDQLVVSTDALVERDGRQVPLRLDNGGEGRAYGMELSIRHELANNFFGWVAYTLSRSERLDPSTGQYELFDFDQTHILAVIGSYRLPRGWEISARYRYVTGNLYTPVIGRVWDADDDAYLPIMGRTNSARVGSFQQFDFRIDKRWVFNSWMLNVYLDIQNVFDRRNPDGVSYSYDYSETTSGSGLPIIPVLGIRGEL